LQKQHKKKICEGTIALVAHNYSVFNTGTCYWGEPERTPHSRNCIAHVGVYACLVVAYTLNFKLAHLF